MSAQEWWEVRAPGGLPLRAGPSLTAEVVGEVLRQQRIQVRRGKFRSDLMGNEWIEASFTYRIMHDKYIYIYIYTFIFMYIYIYIYTYIDIQNLL